MAVHVALTPQQEEQIAKLVEDGVYKDATEAVGDGLRRITRDRQIEADKLEALRAAVAQGLDDLDAGRYVDVSDADLDEFIASRGRAAAERVAASDGR